VTKQGLQILLERVSAWPAEAQEEFVRSLSDIESRYLGVHRLNEAERDAVRRGLANMREGSRVQSLEVIVLHARHTAQAP